MDMISQKTKFSLVIAVYNEEENVKVLTDRIYASLKEYDFELIYIIDGTDNSFKILNSLKNKNLILDYSPQLRGFRNAFIKGFSLVRKDSVYVITLDADLNHKPEEILSLINQLIETNSDILVGSRYLSEGKVEKLELRKRLISLVANLIIKFIWRINLKDKTSGFRVYRKNSLDRIWPLTKSKNFEFLFELLILAKKFNFKISEAPIHFIAREHGQSKFNLWKVANGYLKLIFTKWELK